MATYKVNAHPKGWSGDLIINAKWIEYVIYDENNKLVSHIVMPILSIRVIVIEDEGFLKRVRICGGDFEVVFDTEDRIWESIKGEIVHQIENG